MNRAPLMTLLLLAACGGPAPAVEHVAVEPADDPAVDPGPEPCTFDGSWQSGQLSTPDGEPFVRAGSAHARGAIDTSGLHVELFRAGWELRGVVDLENEEPLVVTQMLWLNDTVAVLGGANVRVVAVRPPHVQVTVSRYAPGAGTQPELGVMYNATIEAWVSCDDLALRGRVQPPIALEGLGIGNATQRRLPPDASVGVSAGAEERTAQVTLGPRELALPLSVLETRGERARVLRAIGAGVVVRGWIDASALVDPPNYESRRALVGRIGIPPRQELDVCTSSEQQTLYVDREDGPFAVGFLRAGTRFVRLDPEGRTHIEPHPADDVFVAGERTWSIDAAVLDCRSETYSAGDGPGLLGAPRE